MTLVGANLITMIGKDPFASHFILAIPRFYAFGFENSLFSGDISEVKWSRAADIAMN